MKNPRSLESVVFSARFIQRAAILLVSGVLVLIAISVIFGILFPVPSQSIRFQINLDEEGNLTTWYNSTLFLLVSLAAFTLAWLCSERCTSKAERRIDGGGWVFSGLVFLYLAVDDAAQIHDLLAWPLEKAFRESNIPGLSEAGWYTWIPIYIALGVITLAVMFRFFKRNIWKSRSTSVLVLLGIFCFLLNPIIEFLENKRVDLLPVIRSSPSISQQLYEFDHGAWVELQLLIIIEESAEMLGAIFFLLAFLEFGRRLLAAPIGPGRTPVTGSPVEDVV